jgi:hypothetical protein
MDIGAVPPSHAMQAGTIAMQNVRTCAYPQEETAN